ncbi:hypothetical protein ACFOYW_00425 [Gryllotalpicola reticulitermitis]|uniref:Uncharacterized protein n=1 Tax=Gryllotalpicola reticulitermitis TaxID=1184153 RepID=A0ABV8Q396_9MICO
MAIVSAMGLRVVSIDPAELSQRVRDGLSAAPPTSGPLLAYGPLLVFAPLAGLAVFAAVIAVRPGARWEAAPSAREADLTAEQPPPLWRELARFGAAAIALLVLVVLVGGAAGSGSSGSALTVADAGRSDEVAYPGWRYVLAVIVAVLVVSGLVLVAVVRARTSPGPGIHRWAAADHAVRSWQAGVVSLAATVAMTLSVGVIAWSVGAGYATIARFSVVGKCRSIGPGSSICRQVGVNYAQPAFAVGVSEVVFGAILVAISLTLMLVIAQRIRRGIRVVVISPTDTVPA